MQSILIKNGRVWNGEKFVFSDVLTYGKTIAKIGEKLSETADFVYDATDKIVSAGFVDAHVHLKGFSSDDFGVDAESCSFPYGVTAVCDAGSIFGDEYLLENLPVKNVVFVGVDIKNNHAYFENTEKYFERFGKKAIGIKVYFDKTICDVADITPLKEICDYAKIRHKKVMVHCSNSPTRMLEIVETLSKGDILTHAYHGGTNNCLEQELLALQLAKEKGVVIDSGFAGHVHTNFAVLKYAFENNYFPDTISTDVTKFSLAKRGGDYGLTMCMSIAKELGMNEDDIFKAVTSSCAKALDKQNDWGALKVGMNADVCVVDYLGGGFDLTDEAGNTIKSNKSYRCVLTICDGKIMYNKKPVVE